MDAVYIATIIIALTSLVYEYLRTLMMLQQNSYRNERYMKWLRTSGDTTTGIRMFAMIALFASLAKYFPDSMNLFLIILVSVINSVKLVRAKYKKPLVMTNRAWRIFITMAILSIIILSATATLLWKHSGYDIKSILYALSITALALYIGSHIVVLAANTILLPIEKLINKRYYNDAARILASIPNLKIVGITGSYGKTSTKHYLNRILSEKYDVLMTPGSYNTTLGVIRTIREMLKPYNEVFIVEMGAKQLGDIKEICDLVRPEIGIVTAIGEQHLESFKSIENVQRTKFELVDALPTNGLAVVNNDFEYGANRIVTNVDCKRYAVENIDNADFIATNIKYSATGTTFTIKGDGKELTLSTKLVGECNISNLIAAIIVALKLEVAEEKIKYAVEKIEQVEHRLNLKRTPGGITIIDDAFNSNPSGSKMALEVLGSMTGGKRIIVTPGMIELGDKQYEYNERFGSYIASNADVAIIVGEYNREAIVNGIKAGGMNEENIYQVTTFSDAQQTLTSIVKPGDYILYENDLPDTFK